MPVRQIDTYMEALAQYLHEKYEGMPGDGGHNAFDAMYLVSNTTVLSTRPFRACVTSSMIPVRVYEREWPLYSAGMMVRQPTIPALYVAATGTICSAHGHTG